MERFVKGDVVIVPFPFSNLSDSKKRPALVIANTSGNDLMLAQITSKYTSNYSLNISNEDFGKGNLPLLSFVKINKLFSADKSIVNYKIGTLKQNKIKEVENKLVDLFRR